MFGRRALEQLAEPCEVLAQRVDERGRTQRGGRVEQRHDENGATPDLVHLRGSAHPGDPDPASGQQLGGEVAERRDHPRLDQIHLPEQVRLARLDLDRLRIAVSGRATLQDVADPNVGALQTDPGQQLGQEPAGAPTNGRPCRSSSAPGASPTKTKSASEFPAPKTTLVRVLESAHLVHSEASR